MRSRAALLPHPADPFLFKYWIKYFNEVWSDEVDKLYILVNSPIEPSVIEYMRSLVADNPKIDFEYIGYQIEHCTALDVLVEKCKESHIMLIEDDGFIFKKGMVDKCFKELEDGNYDIVGSARGSCSFFILDHAREKWGIEYMGEGDQGCNFWPNFFFIAKNVLRETDRRYGARAWEVGETIEPLGVVVEKEQVVGDTFVNTSLQLRAKNLRIKLVPQYHGSPDDIEHQRRQYNLFDGQAPWCHIGSLSSGVHGVLMDNNGRMLGRRTIDPPKDHTEIPNYCNSEGEKMEWERRVQWWSRFHDNSDPSAIVEFRELYGLAIERIIEQYGLNRKHILKRKEIYKDLGL